MLRCRSSGVYLSQRKSILLGTFYFLLFSVLFFVMSFWVSGSGTGSAAWGGGEKIALIRIEGVILDAREVVRNLQSYQDDPSIKAILLRIDSPGGAVAPSQEIYDALLAIKAAGDKKIVSSMGTIAASGGYYIASATDLIYANAGTLTGSIGVIMQLTNVEGLMQKIGVENITIKSGANKDLGSPFRKMKPEERKLLQDVMDDVHNQFIEAVVAGRSLDIETVRQYADGRIFSGRQAQRIGLVDELGSLTAAIKKTAELAGIEGDPVVIEPSGKSALSEFLEGRVFKNWSKQNFSFSSIGMHYLFAS